MSPAKVDCDIVYAVTEATQYENVDHVDLGASLLLMLHECSTAAS